MGNPFIQTPPEEQGIKLTKQPTSPLDELFQLSKDRINIGDFDNFKTSMKKPEARREIFQLLSPFVELGEFEKYDATVLADLPQDEGFFDKAFKETREFVGLAFPALQSKEQQKELEIKRAKVKEENLRKAKVESIIPKFAESIAPGFREKVIEKINEDPSILKELDGDELMSLSKITGIPFMEFGPQIKNLKEPKVLLEMLKNAMVGPIIPGQVPREGVFAEAIDTPLVNVSDSMSLEPPASFLRYSKGSVLTTTKGEEVIFEGVPTYIFEEKTRDILWGLSRGAVTFIEGLTSPGNVALMVGTAGTSSFVIPAIFSADMLSATPELAIAFKDAVKAGNTREAAELLAITSLTAGMGIHLGKTTYKRFKKDMNIISFEGRDFIRQIEDAINNDPTFKDRVDIEVENIKLEQFLIDAPKQPTVGEILDIQKGETTLPTRSTDVRALLPERTPRAPSELKGEAPVVDLLTERVATDALGIELVPRKSAEESASVFEKQIGEIERRLRSPKAKELLRTQLAFQENMAKRGVRPGANLQNATDLFFESLKNTVKGLGELFSGDPNTLNTLIPIFTEAGFKRSRPHFERAWEKAKQAGMEFSEFSEFMIKGDSGENPGLGKNAIPYLNRFRSELIANGFFTDFDPNDPKARSVPEGDRVKLLDKEIPRDASVEDRVRIERENLDTLGEHNRKWHEVLADVFSVQDRYNRIGMKDVGVAVKNFFSVEFAHQERALNVASKIGSSVKKFIRPDNDALQEMGYAAESKVNRAKLSPTQEAAYAEGLGLWSNYKKFAAEELARFGEKSSPMKQIKSTVRGMKNRRQARGENLRDLEIAEDALSEMSSITTEASLFLQKLMQEDVDAANGVIATMSKAKVKDVNFDALLETGLIDPSQIHIMDFVGMLGRRLGRDVGQLEIRKAGLEEGLIRKEGKTKEPPFSQWSIPPRRSTFLDGYLVRAPLAEWYLKMTTPSNRGMMILDMGISTVKMAAFWNPLFLPMYDIYQASMTGVLKQHLIGAGIGGKIAGAPGAAAGFIAGELVSGFVGGNRLGGKSVVNGTLARGFRHAFGRSELYHELNQAGMSSTPFPNLFESHTEAINHIKNVLRPRFGNIVAAAIGEGLNLAKAVGRDVTLKQAREALKSGDHALQIMIKALPNQTLKEMYNLSWGLAWELDRAIRTSTAIYLMDQGFSLKEAAQLSALTHGDYAAVPVATRKMMNRFLFTPTFKIAMAKLQGNMVAGAIKGGIVGPDIIRGVFGQSKKAKKLTPKEAHLGSGLFYGAAVLMGFHLYMKSQGFETDVFGTKYTKPTQTDEGPKDIVVSHPTPANIYIKYGDRTLRALAARPDQRVKKLFNSFKWEVTPMFRIMSNWVNNRDDNGEPIVLSTDTLPQQVGKDIKYIVLNTYQILGLIAGDEEQEVARKALAKETSQALKIALAPFTFTYLRDPEAFRIQKELESFNASWSEDIREGRIDPINEPNRIRIFMDRVNSIIEKFED